VQDPNTLLAILRTMAQKPEVQFDKLFQKLYNIDLWLLAYQSIAPKPGNMTAGVDGKTIDGAGLKLITDLIADLKASRYTSHPVRRTYIPKANGKLRPLGIPGFQEKLLQTVVKLILEAIYEPTFSNMSHGFRPQRSCHTALEQIKNEMYGVRWWVEGDIKGFFDRISHEWLLAHIPMDKAMLSKWLKAGYMENRRLYPTEEGTPQGGICSPVIANMTLDGLERLLASHFPKKGRPEKRAKVNLIRYADDFCITGSSKELLEQEVKPLVEQFLSERGLQLSSEKTVITHIEQGFDFLVVN
jgi:group II intron reverse transcriptase/maturase